MNSRIKTLRQQLRFIVDQIEFFQKENIPKDQFPKIMKEFVLHAKIQLDKLEEKNVKMTKVLKELATLFDEDEAALLKSPAKFFEDINTFIEQFRDAERKIVEAEQNAELRRAKEEQKRKEKEEKKKEENEKLGKENPQINVVDEKGDVKALKQVNTKFEKPENPSLNPSKSTENL